MPVKITIDIFSGRPNPEVEISGKEAQDMLERLKSAGQQNPLHAIPSNGTVH